MRLLKKWELQRLEQERCIDIINKFLDWDILPMKYFESISIYTKAISFHSNLDAFENMIWTRFEYFIDNIWWERITYVCKKIWGNSSRRARTEILKALIMQDMNSEHISEEIRNIFWDLYNPIMDDLILNKLTDEWEFNI